MPHAPIHPEFPAAIEQLAPEGVLESLSALELGAWYRLQRAAWTQPEPCTLPAEDSFLAMVARITVEELAAAKPRLLLALAASSDTAPSREAAGGTGRLTLGYARRVFESLASRALEVRRVKQAAGRAGAESRWRQAPDSTCMAPAKQLPSAAIAAPSLRSEFSESLALSLQRSNQSAKSERSEEEGARDVLATVGAGARALLAEKTRDWRRKKSLALLEDAIARWVRDGFTSCPIDKAFELVEHESASPDRVEHLVQSGDAMLARFKASGGRRPNPIGLLISGLGLSASNPRPPCEVPLFIAQRWATAEAESVRAMESLAAVQARISALRDSKSVGSLAGPASGRGVVS